MSARQLLITERMTPSDEAIRELFARIGDLKEKKALSAHSVQAAKMQLRKALGTVSGPTG